MFTTLSCIACGRAARTWVGYRNRNKDPYCSAFCRRREDQKRRDQALAQQQQRKSKRKKKKEKKIERRLSYLKRRYGDSFYTTREWQQIRYEAFKKYGRQCILCGAKAGNGNVLHVDHIKPRSKYPELAMDLTNLQILCEPCNIGKSNTDETDWRI